jgi:diguanylate cyclase (GGDEF)-like protein
MTPDHEAARQGGYYGWTVPLNYQSVHELNRKLKIPPYSNYDNVTMTQVLAQYWYWVVIALAIIFILSFMSLRMRYLNQLLVRTEQELKEYNSILQEIASRDSLTKLANRRKLDESLTQEWWRACREQKPISAILIDIDHFKEYNDLNGHLAGDAYLVKLSEYIEHTFKRSADIKARYGGDEFVVVLPDTSNNECQRLAETLKTEIDKLVKNLKFNPETPLSISLGIATLVPEQNSVPESLIAAADAALYQSKSQGKSRIQSADTPTIN